MLHYQDRLKRQISRSTFFLLVAFLLIFAVMLGIYSAGYTSFQNANYCQEFTKEFETTYNAYNAYLSSKENTDTMRSCLRGEITPQNMSYLFHTYSYTALHGGDLLLLDGKRALVFSTMNDVTMHMLYLCQDICQSRKAQTRIYTTVYYMTAGDAKLLYAKRLDDDGWAFLFLDGNEWSKKLGRTPYDYVIAKRTGAVVTSSNPLMVDALNQFKNNGARSAEYGDQRYMVSQNFICGGQFVAYTLMPRVSWIAYYCIGCMCVIAAFFLMMSSMLRSAGEIASRNSRSVEVLHDEFNIIQDGDIDHQIRLDTGDEFQEIADHINSMMADINKLNRRNMELMQLNNSAEIAQLEARFHPHFIYNTLENIRYAILLGDPDQAGEMLQRLTALLRYSADNSSHMTPLEQDMRKLEDYLEIIRFRRDGSFFYHLQIDEAAKGIMVPKLLVQPLVENSVKYGYAKKEALHVDVSACLCGDTLTICVRDDGTGMEPAALAALQDALLHPRKEERQSGLRSIARRVKLLYGQGSGVSVESRYMESTCVRLTMTLQEGRDV